MLILILGDQSEIPFLGRYWTFHNKYYLPGVSVSSEVWGGWFEGVCDLVCSTWAAKSHHAAEELSETLNDPSACASELTAEVSKVIRQKKSLQGHAVFYGAGIAWADFP